LTSVQRSRKVQEVSSICLESNCTDC